MEKKKILLFYPPGPMFQRGEDRCQQNVDEGSAQAMRACNDLGYAAAVLLKRGYDIKLRDFQTELCTNEQMYREIDEYRPDLIITLDRPAALIAARTKKIACLPIVNSLMYRTASFPVKLLQPLNQILSAQDFEQVFRVSDLYDYAKQRVVFGAIQVQPMPFDADVQRFGTVSSIPAVSKNSRNVYVYLHAVHKKPAALKKILVDTFKGAPYEVYASIEGADAEKIDNIHFLSRHRDDWMRQCAVCIHDGNDYITDICCASATVQLIITDHRYGRTSNALAARRYGFGLMSDENDLKVSSLYENYRRLVSDEKYQNNAFIIRDEVISLGDFDDFYRFVLLNFLR